MGLQGGNPGGFQSLAVSEADVLQVAVAAVAVGGCKGQS